MSDYAKEFIGKPAAELPTPSFVLSLPLIKQNIATLHRDVEALGIGFRPHIKTLKTLEVTSMMLADGKYRSAVASTLPEIRGLLPLVADGKVDECLYGLPVCPSYIPQLQELRKSLRIQLMVDHAQQIAHLERFAAQVSQKPQAWDVFIKIDVGARRAGVVAGSTALEELVRCAESSQAVNVVGFYCHANNSYAGRTEADAEAYLNNEVKSALDAAALLPADRKVKVSIGATPTAHVVKAMKASIPSNIEFELHAGNFPCNDLQQVSTGLVNLEDQAGRVLAEVVSVYPGRNEALVNAGVVALSRETSAFEGFGRIVNKPSWEIMRLSQEHGIIGTKAASEVAESNFEVGQRVSIYVNHVCITAAAFEHFYVVDEQDIVQEIWTPWKFW